MHILDHTPLGVNWGYHPLVYWQVLESGSSPLHNCCFWLGQSSFVVLSCFLCWLYFFTLQSFSFTVAVIKWWSQASLSNHDDDMVDRWMIPSLDDTVVIQTFFWLLHQYLPRTAEPAGYQTPADIKRHWDTQSFPPMTSTSTWRWWKNLCCKNKFTIKFNTFSQKINQRFGHYKLKAEAEKKQTYF